MCMTRKKDEATSWMRRKTAENTIFITLDALFVVKTSPTSLVYRARVSDMLFISPFHDTALGFMSAMASCV